MSYEDIEHQLDEDPAVCGRSISYLYRRSGAYFSVALKKLGLTTAQSIVLIGVYRYDGINQRALGDVISMTPGVVSRTLRELEDKDYVTKERDETNRRNYLLHVTPKGRELAEADLQLQERYWHALLCDLTPQEIGILNSALIKMGRRSRE